MINMRESEQEKIRKTWKIGMHFVGTHCKEILIMYILPVRELRGLSPNFHIHLSVSDL
jgi:hypothetical protein